MAYLVQDEKLARLIQQVPVFKHVSSIAPLGGGLTNINYRVDTTEGSYVLRVSDTKSATLGINRENERVNTGKAYEAGVGAELLYAVEEENALVIRWIEARTLHEENIKTEVGLVERMAAALRQLHSCSPFAGNFYFSTIRKKYLNTVLTNHYTLPVDYLYFESFILDLEAALELNPEPLVSCNNDLLAENFMDDGNKIWIIDYEYAGLNEASFDIGNLASEIFLNDDQLTHLCDAYWQKHLPGKVARAQAWSMIARFGWTLWASIQSAISTIDFDFHTWGMKKWNSLLPELQGERYKMVLENLKKYNK